MSISRVELLKQGEMLERAELGIELIEERLSSLIKEFKNIAKEISLSREGLEELDFKAMRELGNAIADEGSVIEKYAKTGDSAFKPTVKREKIYGINIPKISKTSAEEFRTEYSFPITLSSAVSTAKKKFEQLYAAYISYVDQIIVLQQLGQEIKRTRRQMMVLENDVIPALKSKIDKINFILDEREREEQIRLRKFKQKHSR